MQLVYAHPAGINRLSSLKATMRTPVRPVESAESLPAIDGLDLSAAA